MENLILVDGTQMQWRNVPHAVPVDQVQFDKLRIQTGPSWAGLNVVAQFGQCGKAVSMPVVDGECDYPTGFRDGQVEICLLGYPAQGDRPTRATTNRLAVYMCRGGFQGAVPEIPPSPDLYAQLLAQINKAAASAAPYPGENGNWFFWNPNESAFVDSGISAYQAIPPEQLDRQLKGAVAEYFENNPVDVPVATASTTGVVAVGSGLKVTETGLLSVDATALVERGNPNPVTSGGVAAAFAVINDLLSTI